MSVQQSIIEQVKHTKENGIIISKNLHDLLSGEHGGFSPAFAAAVTSSLELPAGFGSVVSVADAESITTDLGIHTFIPKLSSKAVNLFRLLRTYDPSIMRVGKYVKALGDIDVNKYDTVQLIQVVHARMLKTDSSLWDSVRDEKIIDPLLLNQLKVVCLELSALLIDLDKYIVDPELATIQYPLSDMKITLANAAYVSLVLENSTQGRYYRTITELRKLQFNIETLDKPEFFQSK